MELLMLCVRVCVYHSVARHAFLSIACGPKSWKSTALGDVIQCRGFTATPILMNHEDEFTLEMELDCRTADSPIQSLTEYLSLNVYHV